MTLLTKTTLRNSWRRLKEAQALTVRLRLRVDVGGAVKFMRRGVADLLFPQSCVGCEVELGGEVAFHSDVPICDGCLQAIELFSGSTCVSVVRRFLNSRRCTRERAVFIAPKMWFDETVALGHYDGKLRELILRMKRADGDSISLAMGRLILEKRPSRLAEIGADVVVPVPLHWRRRLAHRTNSAAVLAEVLAGRLGVPLADRLLWRSRSTVPQFDLSPPERWKNVRGAFSVRAGYHLRMAHVLLVDDVLTTGATCSEAARALRNAVAERVTVAVVARAMGN